MKRKILSPHCKRDIKNKANLVIRTLRKESFYRFKLHGLYILGHSVYLQKALSAHRIAVIKGNLWYDMQASAIYSPCGASVAFCGYTWWPKVYKPYNSTVQTTLYEESELQGLPCFWYPIYNGDSKFYALPNCEINNLNINVTCILTLREH